MAGSSAWRALRCLVVHQQQAGVHASLSCTSSVALMHRMADTSHRAFSASSAPGSEEATSSLRAALGYCIHQVRTYDYENFVWATQLPKELRPAVFALRAFNIETALVADQVKSKEPAMVQVRFQWWRDGLSAAYAGDPPKHPVLVALAGVLQQSPSQQPSTSSSSSQLQQDSNEKPGGRTSGRTPLKSYHFKRMIDAREADLLDTQPPLSIEGLEKYAEGTASQLLYLHLAAAGIQSREADHAASHLGKAVGLTTLLRGVPYHAQRRRSYLPIDLCVEHGVSQEDVYAGKVTEGMRDVVLAVASNAKGHLDESRALASRLPKGASQVLLSSIGCARYLEALEAANFDPFHASLQSRPGVQGAPLMYVLAVKYHMLMGTY